MLDQRPYQDTNDVLVKSDQAWNGVTREDILEVRVLRAYFIEGRLVGIRWSPYDRSATAQGKVCFDCRMGYFGAKFRERSKHHFARLVLV